MAKKSSRSQADDSSGTPPAASEQTPKPRRRRASGKGPAPQPSSTAAETSTSAAIALPPGVDNQPSAIPSKSASRPDSTIPPLSEEAIRTRAYQRYLERGGGHGMAFDDWFEAERELTRR